MKNKEKKIASPLPGAERQSNFELYRIFLMALLIMHHYIVNSGVIGGPIAQDTTAKRALLYLAVGAWGQTAVNGFVLLSAYFMCQKEFSGRKYARLLGEVMFYRILFEVIFWCVGYEPFSAKALLKSLIPVTNMKDSEVQAVLVVYLCIPILNRLIKALSRRMHLAAILLSGFIFTICGSFAAIEFAGNYVTWFCALYLVGAYIRLYPAKYYEKRDLWLMFTACSFGISLATVVNCVHSGKNAYTYVNAPYLLMPTLNAVTSFMLFRRLHLPKVRAINTVAAATFGVLLIHTAGAPMRRLLWTDLLKVSKFYWASGPVMLLHIAGSVVAVYAVCAALDLLRIRFVERPLLRLWDRYAPAVKTRLQRFDGYVCRLMHLE